MAPRTHLLLGCLAAACIPLAPVPTTAQGRGLDVTYGRWWHGGGGAAESISAAYYRPFLGPLDYGIGFTHLDDSRSVDDRTLTGGELSLALSRDGAGVYGVTTVGLGMRHSDGSVDAAWSAGAGYAMQPLPFVSVGVEARYRQEDTRLRGFWRPDAADRRGFFLQGRLALRLGGGSRTAPPIRPAMPVRGTFRPPSESEIFGIARANGSSGAAAALATTVVQTALAEMGTPYQWGGTDENGFDCSGLIYYAYREHGILLPRVSRDQARTGSFIEPRLDQLLPGDILGFSVERTRARVTHVGLYVGNGQFIHSASEGVKISSLTATDLNSRWWQRRFVVARRVIN